MQVRRVDGPGWATQLGDAAIEPSRSRRAEQVYGIACVANGDAAMGPDETFRIAG